MSLVTYARGWRAGPRSGRTPKRRSLRRCVSGSISGLTCGRPGYERCLLHRSWYRLDDDTSQASSRASRHTTSERSLRPTRLAISANLVFAAGSRRAGDYRGRARAETSASSRAQLLLCMSMMKGSRARTSILTFRKRRHSFFRNHTGTPRPVERISNFGYTIGGPIHFRDPGHVQQPGCPVLSRGQRSGGGVPCLGTWQRAAVQDSGRSQVGPPAA